MDRDPKDLMPALLVLDDLQNWTASLVGTKAARLATMHVKGVLIPETLVIRRGCIWDDLTPSERRLLEHKVETWGGKAIVRTSALGEDGMERSLAGIYQSKIVPGKDLKASIEALIDHAEKVQQNDYIPAEGSVAIMIQRIVNGPGGVYLSQDPASPGSHLLQMAPNGTQDITGGNQFDRAIVPEVIRSKALLLCKRLETLLPWPIDVELVVEQGIVHLVQVRPQTALVTEDDFSSSQWSPALFKPYFPFPLPPLAADLWAELFSKIFNTEVINQDGVLHSRKDLELPAPRSSLESATDAITYWENKLKPRWTQQVQAASVAADRVTNPEDAWLFIRGRWEEFMIDYFNSPISIWLNRAFSKIEQEPDAPVACRPTIQRLRVLEDVRISVQADKSALQLVQEHQAGELISTNTEAGIALRKYLKKYGHYSTVPDDFSRPYPAENPNLLRQVLLSPNTLIPNTLLENPPANEWARLLEIAEEDNDPKYRLAATMRRFICSLGEALHHKKMLEHPDNIWMISLENLDSVLQRGQQVDVSMKLSSSYIDSEEPSKSEATGAYIWYGEPLANGRAGGYVWKGEEDVEVEGDLVLVCEVLTPGMISKMTRCKAIVTAFGGRASHGSIIAREFGVVAVASTSAYQALRSGDIVMVDGWRGVIRRKDTWDRDI